MAFANLLAPPNHLHQPFQIPNGGRIPLPKLFNPIHFSPMPRKFQPHPPISTFPRNCASIPTPSSDASDDFISRVLRENPSQVEPRHLVGNRLYTLREEKNFNEASDGGIFQLMKNLYERWGIKLNGDAVGVRKGEPFRPVYLKDMLREFKGKLYVPEEIFAKDLSEEEEFDRNLDKLPKMSYEDFQKAVRSDKVKLLTSKSLSGADSEYAYHDFIVDLKEIPGDKQLHRTKWSIRLRNDQARPVLEEYRGPQYEIEKHTMSYVGKVPEYPHPVASSISSRVMVALGTVAVLIAAAALLLGGFLASAVFTVTSFIFAGFIYVVWPLIKPLVKLVFSLALSTVVTTWENAVDFFSKGGIISKLDEFYTLVGLSASGSTLTTMLIIVLPFTLLIRYTLTRRPRNFKRWDIWQGIEFGRSKAQARVDGSTGVGFSDVAGIDDAVEELQELVRYLKNPELFEQMGIKPPHGVLLEGPPGCGKTLVAKAIAGEAGVPFYQMAGSEFVEILVGVGSARIRDLFKRAKVNKPSVIFIDEIDALGTRRDSMKGMSSSSKYSAATQERETTLNQLLIELDGFDTGKGVIFLGATNRMDLLDSALLRPGRFDRKIRIRPPGTKGRLDILKVHARKFKLSPSVDLSIYARNLTGWTGAKLAQLLQEAALVAVRNKHDSILESDLNAAVDRLTVGPKSVGVDLDHEGQRRRSTTEVGTAMTSHLLRRYEDANLEFCERISIYPRGATFSQIVFRRLEDWVYVYERRYELLHRLQVFLGGRAAEEVIYGRDTSTESVNNLIDASWLARKMITIWNLENPMSIHGEPTPWKKANNFIGPRLDFEGSLYQDYGLFEPPINFCLDDEVAQRTERLMRDTFEKTVSLLRRHQAALVKTVHVLLDRKEISGHQIDYIIDRYPADTPVALVLEEENPGSISFPNEAEQGRGLTFLPGDASKESIPR